MGKNILVDVDVVGKGKSSFDSVINSTISSTNSASFSSSFTIMSGIMVGLLGPKPIKTFAKVAVHIIGDIVKNITKAVINVRNFFRDFASNVRTILKNIGGIFKYIFKVLSSPFQLIGRTWKLFKDNGFKGGMKKIWDFVKNKFVNELKNFTDFFVDKYNKVINFFKETKKSISTAVSKIVKDVSNFFESGKKIFKRALAYYKLNGFIKTVKKTFTTGVDIVGGLAKKTLDFFKKMFANIIDRSSKSFKIRKLKVKSIGNSNELLISALNKKGAQKLMDINKEIKSSLNSEELLINVGKKTKILADEIGASKYLKNIKRVDSIVSSIPIISETFGLIIGTIADSFEFHSYGSSWFKAITVSFLGNAMGSVAGITTDALSVFVGIPPGLGFITDALVTDSVENLFFKEHSKTQTFKDLWQLIKHVAKYSMPSVFIRGIGEYISRHKKGYDLDTSNISNNLTDIDTLYKKHSIFSSVHLSEILNNMDKIPTITGMAVDIMVNGVSEDGIGDSTDDSVSTVESDVVEPIKFSYPQYFLLKFFRNVKNIVTKNSIDKEYDLYGAVNNGLKDDITTLSSKLDRLKTKYEAL